jgi:sec-independent protein translocase protein TatB
VLGLSPVRLLIIVVVALIVLGPDKLPQVAKQAGVLWHSLRTLQQRVEDEIHEVAPDLPRSADLLRYARSPVALLNQLADHATADHSADHAATDEAERDEPVPDGAYPPTPQGVAYRPPDDAPEVKDPSRPPLAWGDPSLN